MWLSFFLFSDPQYIQNMWLAAVDPLVEIIKSEPEPDIVSKFVEALAAVCGIFPFLFILMLFLNSLFFLSVLRPWEQTALIKLA